MKKAVNATIRSLPHAPDKSPVTITIPPARPARPAVVAVANAKGGVGKTSIVANLAGLAAASGSRVLAIDLDPQGNLAIDLGYRERSDNGRGLASVFRTTGDALTVTNVRPGLDAWPGGPDLVATVPSALIPEVAHPLTEAIAATGASYDIVFIDCPPALGPLVDAGLMVADLLLVPIRADHASLDGLAMISERFSHAQVVNSRLELLGVTLFDVSRAATALVRDIAAAIGAGFAGHEPRLLPAIRRSERSAFEMRSRGLLAHEYAGAATDSPAAHLADDYRELARQVLASANQRRTQHDR
jgi:chromosome partitioning protein